MPEIRIVNSADIENCRIKSLSPAHYKNDGSCKCPIRLVRDGISAVYTEEDQDVTWVSDEYTEPRDTLYDCVVCERPIEDWTLFTCLDGGEAAHNKCVEVVQP